MAATEKGRTLSPINAVCGSCPCARHEYRRARSELITLFITIIYNINAYTSLFNIIIFLYIHCIYLNRKSIIILLSFIYIVCLELI